ncbi:maleylpyruvate isomerase family mycothiol-dependent enzyme [Streptomyces sp. RKND-216]|uniref:maleylpyruvate isomerase N-terminal domain-containing protein n=1 Tax=Streptomyces sp. RKND-216 TaxID=2562581 RepID=UPI00109D9A4E|nr:maleylpyruvate isomerase N-terminal domain-containing protein [Streptomyces sp. RKND-216]THA25699.1 maleylpyruvate isomerase family mycothiol-dependent enzyme [Streptomyces sp. RKND-216]
MTTSTSPDPRLDHARYCAEILEQTRLLRRTLDGADLSATVPTCPEWSLRELVVHVGGSHRWAHEIVRTRAAEEVEEETVPGFHGPTAAPDAGGDDGRDAADAQALDAWLAEGAELLVAALREAGPDTRVWSWSARADAGFWARRMTHETVVHRFDAAGAVPGTPYEVDAEVAADCVDEWLDILTDPVNEDDEELHALRARAGESLHLHATDAPDGVDAEWVIELTGDGIAWRRSHAKATVALRGPLTDLLRVFHRRLPADAGSVEVLGDRGLLDVWLECTRWG